MHPFPNRTFDASWLEGTSRRLEWTDGEIVYHRLEEQRRRGIWRTASAPVDAPVACLMLEHENAISAHLDPNWANAPVGFFRTGSEYVLVYEGAQLRPSTVLTERPFDIGRFLDFALNAAQALGNAHAAGIAMRRVGETSLLVDVSNRVKLSGFGEARFVAAERADESIGRGGTDIHDPRFVPRHQLNDDIYALGRVLAELLARGMRDDEPARQADRNEPPVPGMIGELLAKATASEANDRYHSIAALKADLARCRTSFAGTGRIAPFILGRLDARNETLLSSKQSGREAEALLLEEALRRVRLTDEPEIALISGPAGIGKSALFEQVSPIARGLGFTIGHSKCDQLLADTPYAPVAELLRLLFTQAIGGDELDFALLQSALSAMLRGRGQLLNDLVPEAELVLGRASGLGELPMPLARERFEDAILGTIEVFATAERPLLIFIDDLQWADPATADLLEHMAAALPPHILLVLATRNEEPPQRIAKLLSALRASPFSRTSIYLTPLTGSASAELIAASLASDVTAAIQLVAPIFRRTGGNPLFITQLVRSLVAEGAIGLDERGEAWEWFDTDAGSQEQPRNLLDFIAARLSRLPPDSQQIVGLMACIGRRIPSILLAELLGCGVDQLPDRVGLLVAEGYVRPEGGLYIFTHDRVLEAAHDLGRSEQRGWLHASVARALLSISTYGSAHAAFDLANQIERADLSKLDRGARYECARALLAAARFAKSAAALDTAIRYVDAGIGLSDPLWWDEQYELGFELRHRRAEYLVAAGEIDRAQLEVDGLIDRAASATDKARGLRLRALVQTVRSDHDGAVDAALAGLDLLGISLARGALEADLDAARAAVTHALGARSVRDLGSLPRNDDPVIDVAMALLATLISSLFGNDGLRFLHLAKMVELTAQHGVTQESAHGFAWYGVMIGHLYGENIEGLALGEAALALVNKHGFEIQRTSVLVAVDQVCVWAQPLSYALAHIREAVRFGHLAGDVGMNCYARNHLISDLLGAGEPLANVRSELDEAISLARRFGYHDIEALLLAQAGLVEALWSGEPGPFGTARDRAIVHEDTALSTLTQFWVTLYQGMRAYFRGDFALADVTLEEAARSIGTLSGHLDGAQCLFYSGLAIAARSRDGLAPEQQRQRLKARIAAFETWAQSNPATFANKLFLLQGELARLDGMVIEALRLFERSWVAASGAGFVHEQALAKERIAICADEFGFEVMASDSRQAAGASYRRWGAVAKADALDPGGSSGLTLTGPPNGDEPFDIENAVNAAQALSDTELGVDPVATLLAGVIEHSGADRATLLLSVGGRFVLHAITDGGDTAPSTTFYANEPAHHIAPSLLDTVLRTRRPMVVADTQLICGNLDGPDGPDQGARSVMCLPLLRNGDVYGMLYLENRRLTGVFSGNRLNMSRLLAAQAASAIEAARLRSELMDEDRRRTQAEDALRYARAELARTSQLTVLGGMAASIAHEINQPLVAIGNFSAAAARWLERTDPVVGDALQSVLEIQKAGVRAAGIVQALRALAKQAPSAVEEVIIDDVIEEVLNLTAGDIDRAMVILDADLNCGNGQILGDPVQLQQVILNLVTNAVDAMDDVAVPQRRLSIATKRIDDRVEVRISDTGTGVAPDIRVRMFDPLFTTKSNGMGMGLSISQAIINAHGGHLDVRTGAAGTSFSFELPVNPV